MAFVRSPRGAKSRFSIARVSHSISQVYLSAMGPQTSQWRKQIQMHAQSVALALRGRLGDGQGVEWSRAAITAAIEDELRRNAPMEVHERFLELQQQERRTKSAQERAEQWDRFEAMEEANPDRVDPAWTVHVPGSATKQDPNAREELLQDLGEPARKNAKKSPKAPAPEREPTRRSHWLEFWRHQAQLSKQSMDFDVLERQILKLSPNVRQLDPDGWWEFWQQQIDLAMQRDPRLVGLLRIALDRRERALVGGQHWLAGTGLDDEDTPLRLPLGKEGEEVYRRLWKEHIQRVSRSEEGSRTFLDSFDLEALAQAMVPSRDALIDWRGRQWLALAEGVWALESESSLVLGVRHDPKARELPQWAWMRTAMALSVNEDEPTVRAIALYEAISNLAVIPSETMLREAGKAQPRFLEDEAGMVGDQFEAIHDAIHRAAIKTKWTGTVAMDWRQVRSQGAPIAGRRLSQGPIGFMKPVHMSLAAQGRQGEDRPVTVTLPLWHRDIEVFLEEMETGLDRLQAVVSIPDLFFERVQAGQNWTLLDPAAFPRLGEGVEGYLESEAQWTQSPDRASGKTLPAEKLWRRLLKSMSKGFPFITFEGSDRAFSPFPQSAPPVGGIDGVGALPVPRHEDPAFVSWPAAAVDLSKTLDKEGNPDAEKMRHIARVAMRMLDNAITLSAKDESDKITSQYRPVCLGAVGFFEAINRGSASARNDPDLITAWVSALAEAWAKVVLDADQQLLRERGPAPAWQNNPDARPFDPLGSLERLAKARGGARGHVPQPRLKWNAGQYKQGHRCSVRTVWAPYLGAARIAGVTPGGMGTLRPVEPVIDELGQNRWCPTPLLMELLKQNPEDLDTLREVMKHPSKPKKWPAFLTALALPSPEGWERRLLHAAHIRPWIDQGVSLTLPMGMDPESLGTLVKRAWWMGLSNVRFEGMFLDQSLADEAKSMDKPPKSG